MHCISGTFRRPLNGLHPILTNHEFHLVEVAFCFIAQDVEARSERVLKGVSTVLKTIQLDFFDALAVHAEDAQLVRSRCIPGPNQVDELTIARIGEGGHFTHHLLFGNSCE